MHRPADLMERRRITCEELGNSATHQNLSRCSLIQPHLERVGLQQMQMTHSLNNVGGFGTSAETSLLDEDEEKYKKILNERIEKIDREKTQTAFLQKNAQKKAKACERLLAKASQEPSFALNSEISDENEEDRDGQTPTEALIERIYAENRRRAMASAPIPLLPSADLMQQQQLTSTRQLMAEDIDRLAHEYERGLQLLPALIQAMRLQRERRQDILEKHRIIYEEQLKNWDRKVTAHERNQKKVARDSRHREIFERTFVELRKMREERERNVRGVERSRILLAQPAGNGIAVSSTSASAIGLSIDYSTEVEHGDQQMESESMDDKVYAAALVPPIYTQSPRRFFDNRNGIVENELNDLRTLLENFQYTWADVEKAIFNEKIAVYGKNFAAIAAFLPLKIVKECVHYYYMTKKRNNYKLKFARRRKKIGRQGYRPPVMPRFGDSDENFHNYGKDCTFVECLLCDSRILVLDSLSQSSDERIQQFDAFGPIPQSNSSQQEIPICTKCLGLTQRNRTLNRCPLGSCIFIGGKKKMKPVRNIPEKFTTLIVEHKRFLIYRLKMPPTSNKCCTNCYKRIVKDIDDLLLGDLDAELEAFKGRSLVRTQRYKPTLIVEGGEEEEDIADGKPIMGEFWDGIKEQPPLKEIKLELDTDSGMEIKETSDQLAAQPSNSVNAKHGSITKGTPNRIRSSMLAAMREDPDNKDTQSINYLGNIQIDLASSLLAHFGIKGTTLESFCESGLLPTELLNVLQMQAQHEPASRHMEIESAKIESGSKKTLIVTKEDSKGERIETLRRKTGLATALLPSPNVETSANAAKFTRPSVVSPTIQESKGIFVEREASQPAKQSNSGETTVKPEPSCGPSSSYYESLSEDSGDETERASQQKSKFQNAQNTAYSTLSAPKTLTFISLLDLADVDNTTHPDTGPSSSSVDAKLSLPQPTKAMIMLKKPSENTQSDSHFVYEPLYIVPASAPSVKKAKTSPS